MESVPRTWNNVSSNAFLESVEVHFFRVLKYEDPELVFKAKSCIPLETLQFRAINRMRDRQSKIKKDLTSEPEMTLQDALLPELMTWFKESFFNWVDSPPCNICSSSTKYSHNTTSLSLSETIRVEVFKCQKCQAVTEFPRYNDPGILLSTRKGRCGEWANCFTLLCRALDYDTRFIVDTTDHVWTEVYSYTNKKWLHCDPCENIIDSPLLYEAGWGKKLEYVIAYSKDDIQDVTWRYSSDHKSILRRRNKCPEPDLVNLIVRLRNERWKQLSEVRKKFLSNRLYKELVELMIERKAGSDEKVGRSSGSLSWRLQRQETKPWTPHVWKFGEHKEICIRYSTSRDLYEVVLPDGNILETRKQWMNGAYDVQNIFRKEESDWKMVYLAREENADSAKITWKVMTYLRMVIESINIKTSSKTYESGNVGWNVCLSDNCIIIPKSEESNFTLKDIKNISEFTVSANFSGGSGNLAWQHTQIFRQDINSCEYPLQITIQFKVSDT